MPRISEAARKAIARGVARGDPMTELEYLGVSVRTINILENSPFHITRLEQLVRHTREELLTIPSITCSVLQEVLDALARYHELEDARRRFPSLASGQTDWVAEEIGCDD
jgi:DNA-directed RNA polymerase alpha subunit